MNAIKNFLFLSLIVACVPAITATSCKKSKKVHNKEIEQQSQNLLLYYAVRDNKVSEVKELLARGANGDDLLVSMANSGDITACKLLLECGVNVNAQDWLGRTALSFAATHKATPEHTYTIYLRGSGKSVTEQAPADRRHVEICKLLIAEGADVNIKDFYGRTALHYAIEHENDEVCELLLEHGATPVIGEFIPSQYLGVPTSADNPDLVQYWNNIRPTRWARFKTKVINFFKRS